MNYSCVHDDNLGPSVCFEIEEDSANRFIRLRASRPENPGTGASLPDTEADYSAFIPGQIVAAVHSDLRTSPEALHVNGLNAAHDITTDSDRNLPCFCQIGFSRAMIAIAKHMNLGVPVEACQE